MSIKLPQGGNRSYWLLILLFFGLLVILMPIDSHGDRWYWKHWAQYCFEYGVGTIYQYQIDGHVPTNYHPFFLHCLHLFSFFCESIEEVKTNLYQIKFFPLAFDFIGALSIFFLVKRDEKNQVLPFFLLFNIAYLYNSMIWGQIDSIFTTFSLLALLFGLRRQPAASMVFYLLALNTKLQAIIFFPLVALVLLPSIFLKWRQTLLGLLLVVLLQVLLIWPFMQAANLGEMYRSLTTGSVDLYARTSINAYNFWFFFFSHNTVVVPDTELYRGLTYKTWGLLLFCTSSLLTLLPLALRCLRNWWEQKAFDDRSKELVFLAATLIPLAFFFFNTQMHERYSHPALIMAFFYGYYRKNYRLYAFLSIAYFLNLERVMQAFEWSYNTLIFDPIFIATLFSLALSFGLFAIYRRHSLWPDLQYFRSKPWKRENQKE